jgi:sodium/proline symporter
MTSSQFAIVATIVAYLMVMLIIGFYCAKKSSTAEDFYLGGRKLGPLVTAMSAEASDMSSWLLMGLPGLAYISGVADAGWTAIGLAVGTYLNWLLVAKKLRRYSAIAGNAITLPDYFKNRFHDKSNTLLLISALWIIVFFIPYTASGFAACGKLFNSLLGVDYKVAMIASAIIIMLYTTFGGFLAASTTDFMQSIIMTIALFIVLAFGVHTAGGLENVMDNARSLQGYLSFTSTHDPETNTSTAYGFINIITMFAWGLGYFGMPHILLRFMAIEDAKKLTLSRRVASIWVVISLSVGCLIGIVGRAMSDCGAIETLTGSNSETIIVRIATLLSQNGLIFAVIAGLILSGILASTMSTADSQLLAASSAVSQNIIVGVLNLKLTERSKLIIARVTLIVVALIAIFMAKDPDSSVFGIVSFAWAGFGAAFGPIILLSLYWKRTNTAGAVSGMLAGGAAVFIWKYLIRPLGGLWDVYELLPAFILGLIFTVVVSLLTKAPDETIMAEFNRAGQRDSN